MKTCYLHLGMPKTGSSSIQQAFFGYETDRLAYAKLPQRNHGIPVSVAFMRRPTQLLEFRWREATAKEVAERVRIAKGHLEQSFALDKSLILSGEIIIDRLSPDELGALAATLRQHFDRVVAMAYLRPLASLVSSQFQQRIKSGLAEFDLPAPDYRRRFQPVLQHFGAENTMFMRFDRRDLKGGNIVADFASRLGVTAPQERETVANESLTAEGIGALYAYNKFVAPSLRPRSRTRMRQNLTQELRTIGQIRFGLGANLIAGHIDRCREDIDWIERVCGFDMKGDVSEVPDPVEKEEDLLRVARLAPPLPARAG